MINPAQLSISQPDGGERYVIIEPILHKDPSGHLKNTELFKIYKDASADETQLFTEPAENEGQAGGLADEFNPDYLGKIRLSATEWHYEGELLTYYEQVALVEYITNYQSPEKEAKKQHSIPDKFPESANPPEDLPLNPGSLS